MNLDCLAFQPYALRWISQFVYISIINAQVLPHLLDACRFSYKWLAKMVCFVTMWAMSANHFWYHYYVFVFVCVYVCVCVCVCECVYVCVYVCMYEYACMCLYMYVCMYVCMCVCVCMYVHMHVCVYVVCLYVLIFKILMNPI